MDDTERFDDRHLKWSKGKARSIVREANRIEVEEREAEKIQLEQSCEEQEGEKPDQQEESPGAGWTAGQRKERRGRPKGSVGQVGGGRVQQAKKRIEAEIKRIEELSQDIDWGRFLAIILARWETLWVDEQQRIKRGEKIDLGKSSKIYLQFLEQSTKAYKNLKQAVEGIKLTVEPSPQVATQIVEAAKKHVLEVIKIAYEFISDPDDRQGFAERVKGLSVPIDGEGSSEALPARG